MTSENSPVVCSRSVRQGVRNAGATSVLAHQLPEAPGQGSTECGGEGRLRSPNSVAGGSAGGRSAWRWAKACLGRSSRDGRSEMRGSGEGVSSAVRAATDQSSLRYHTQGTRGPIQVGEEVSGKQETVSRGPWLRWAQEEPKPLRAAAYGGRKSCVWVCEWDRCFE